MRYVLFTHDLVIENFAAGIDHVTQRTNQRAEAFIGPLLALHLAGADQAVAAGKFVDAVIAELRLQRVDPRFLQPGRNLLITRQPAAGGLHELAYVV